MSKAHLTLQLFVIMLSASDELCWSRSSRVALVWAVQCDAVCICAELLRLDKLLQQPMMSADRSVGHERLAADDRVHRRFKRVSFNFFYLDQQSKRPSECSSRLGHNLIPGEGIQSFTQATAYNFVTGVLKLRSLIVCLESGTHKL